MAIKGDKRHKDLVCVEYKKTYSEIDGANMNTQRTGWHLKELTVLILLHYTGKQDKE